MAGRWPGCSLPSFLVLLLTTVLMVTPGMDSCPKSCTCPTPSDVHCTFRSLPAIPRGSSSLLRRINMGYNKIWKLTEDSFEMLSNLEVLLLHSNNIYNLPGKVFKQLSSLQLLKLSYNKVKVINRETFYGLKSMLRLLLDNNRIEFIHPDAFHGIGKLRLLNLEGNRLRYLHSNTFVTFWLLDHIRLSTIKHLYLSENELHRLNPNLLSCMDALENLYLQGNPWACDCDLAWILDWDKKHHDVMKCKRDRTYRGGRLCPRCATPQMYKDKELFHMMYKSMACRRPNISSPLKRRGSRLLEDSDMDVFPVPDLQPSLGTLMLNLSDNSMDKAELVCQVQNPKELEDLRWSLNGDALTTNVSYVAHLSCKLDQNQDLQTIWKIIAFYSDYPLHLQKASALDNRLNPAFEYKQLANNKSHYFTGITAVISGSPSWLLQSTMLLQLDRRSSNANALLLKLSVKVGIVHNVTQSWERRANWAMIKRDKETQQEVVTWNGETVELHCYAFGFPKPNVMWVLPDGSVLRSTSEQVKTRYSISTEGKLTIHSVGMADRGVYQCVASAGDDRDVVPFHLEVLSTNSWDINGAEVVQDEGEMLTLPCNTSGLPIPSIVWVFPDRSIMKSEGRLVADNGTLIIPRAETNGYYTCLAINRYGADALTHKVVIQHKPQQLLPARGQGTETRFRVPLESQKIWGNDQESGDGEAFMLNSTKPTVSQTKDLEEEAQGPHKSYLVKAELKTANKKTRKKFPKGRRPLSHHRRGQNLGKLDPQHWAEILARVRQRSQNRLHPTQPGYTKITTKTIETRKRTTIPPEGTLAQDKDHHVQMSFPQELLESAWTVASTESKMTTKAPSKNDDISESKKNTFSGEEKGSSYKGISLGETTAQPTDPFPDVFSGRFGVSEQAEPFSSYIKRQKPPHSAVRYSPDDAEHVFMTSSLPPVEDQRSSDVKSKKDDTGDGRRDNEKEHVKSIHDLTSNKIKNNRTFSTQELIRTRKITTTTATSTRIKSNQDKDLSFSNHGFEGSGDRISNEHQWKQHFTSFTTSQHSSVIDDKETGERRHLQPWTTSPPFPFGPQGTTNGMIAAPEQPLIPRESDALLVNNIKEGSKDHEAKTESFTPIVDMETTTEIFVSTTYADNFIVPRTHDLPAVHLQKPYDAIDDRVIEGIEPQNLFEDAIQSSGDISNEEVPDQEMQKAVDIFNYKTTTKYDDILMMTEHAATTSGGETSIDLTNQLKWQAEPETQTWVTGSSKVGKAQTSEMPFHQRPRNQTVFTNFGKPKDRILQRLKNQGRSRGALQEIKGRQKPHFTQGGSVEDVTMKVQEEIIDNAELETQVTASHPVFIGEGEELLSAKDLQNMLDTHQNHIGMNESQKTEITTGSLRNIPEEEHKQNKHSLGKEWTSESINVEDNDRDQLSSTRGNNDFELPSALEGAMKTTPSLVTLDVATTTDPSKFMTTTPDQSSFVTQLHYKKHSSFGYTTERWQQHIAPSAGNHGDNIEDAKPVTSEAVGISLGPSIRQISTVDSHVLGNQEKGSDLEMRQVHEPRMPLQPDSVFSGKLSRGTLYSSVTESSFHSKDKTPIHEHTKHHEKHTDTAFRTAGSVVGMTQNPYLEKYPVRQTTTTKKPFSSFSGDIDNQQRNIGQRQGQPELDHTSQLGSTTEYSTSSSGSSNIDLIKQNAWIKIVSQRVEMHQPHLNQNDTSGEDGTWLRRPPGPDLATQGGPLDQAREEQLSHRRPPDAKQPEVSVNTSVQLPSKGTDHLEIKGMKRPEMKEKGAAPNFSRNPTVPPREIRRHTTRVTTHRPLILTRGSQKYSWIYGHGRYFPSYATEKPKLFFFHSRPHHITPRPRTITNRPEVTAFTAKPTIRGNTLGIQTRTKVDPSITYTTTTKTQSTTRATTTASRSQPKAPKQSNYSLLNKLLIKKPPFYFQITSPRTTTDIEDMLNRHKVPEPTSEEVMEPKSTAETDPGEKKKQVVHKVIIGSMRSPYRNRHRTWPSGTIVIGRVPGLYTKVRSMLKNPQRRPGMSIILNAIGGQTPNTVATTVATTTTPAIEQNGNTASSLSQKEADIGGHFVYRNKINRPGFRMRPGEGSHHRGNFANELKPHQPDQDHQPQAPNIINGPNGNVILTAQEDVLLPCDAIGNPKPEISWTKVSTGAIIKVGTRHSARFEVFINGTLTIRNSQLRDRGRYVCTARNLHGIDRATSSVSVAADPARMLVGKTRYVSAQPGSMAELTCPATGHPKPRFSWLLPHGQILRTGGIVQAGRASLAQDGTLSLTGITFSDRGMYKCIVANAVGSDSTSVQLHVVALPPLMNQSHRNRIVATQGQPIMLHCSARGTPAPTLRWVVVGGAQVRPSQYLDGRLFVFPNGTLFFKSIVAEDAGQYECMAANMVGMDRSIFDVVVHRNNAPTVAKISAFTLPQSRVVYGGTLQLHCNASGTPAPTIYWQLPSGEIINKDYRNSEGVRALPDGSLVIMAMTEAKSGEYVCIARNGVGEDRMPMRVVVLRRPAKINSKEQANRRILYGDDFKFDCVASGVPMPKISWSLPDGTMVNSVLPSDNISERSKRYVVFGNGTLLLNRASIRDQGDYTCYAENHAGKDEMVVHVELDAQPPAIQSSDGSQVRVQAGQDALLKCHASGKPKPKITWRLPNSELLPSSFGRHLIQPDGSLLLKVAKAFDSGQYMCRARNAAGEAVHLLQLEVSELCAPSINGNTENLTEETVTVVKHMSTTIDCQADGSPKPKVVWVMPGNVVLSAPYYGSRISVHFNGSLELRNVRSSDSAIFLCVARNDVGDARLQIRLSVIDSLQEPSFPSHHAKMVSARPGTLAIVNCSAEGSPAPHVDWTLPDGLHLAAGERNGKLFVRADGSLEIHGVAQEHQGTYMCHARNMAGKAEHTVELKLGVKPRIVWPPVRPLRVVSGQPFFLNCLAEGSPKPSISWLLPSGAELDKPQTSGRASLLRNGTLTVLAASVFDRGNYMCRAQSSLGEDVRTIPVIVIAYPPRITAGPPARVHTRQGTTLHLSCSAIGVPRPEIAWDKPGSLVLRHPDDVKSFQRQLRKQGTLVLRNAQPSDSGTYRCTGRNLLGSDSRSTFVYVI
uniref:immunoglobulin superfamily member 10-like n=1 Tax=Myxine glutinosa TaxID=7769 RepID=UPI00358E0CFA